MHRDDRRPRGNAQASDARRARTLAVALAVLLGATAFYANNVQALHASIPFTVDSAPSLAPARAADPHDAAASPSTFPSDSHGSPMLAVTAPATGRENVPADLRGVALTVTAWTSPGVRATGGPH